jgi:acetyltransferase-like isoleucine patch superfamily enzyme
VAVAVGEERTGSLTREIARPDQEFEARKRAAAPGLKVPPAPICEVGPNGRVTRFKLQDIGFARKVRNRLGELFFNMFITFIPSHTIRQGYLRLFGATIGKNSSILRGTEVLDIEFLTIGDATTIGSRCLLDARSGLWIGDNVVIASHVHMVAGGHDINHPDFLSIQGASSVIQDYVWIATRAMTVSCLIGRGAVVGAQSLVVNEVGELEIVGGVPAKVIGKRDADALGYSGGYRPLFC